MAVVIEVFPIAAFLITMALALCLMWVLLQCLGGDSVTTDRLSSAGGYDNNATTTTTTKGMQTNSGSTDSSNRGTQMDPPPVALSAAVQVKEEELREGEGASGRGDTEILRRLDILERTYLQRGTR